MADSPTDTLLGISISSSNAEALPSQTSSRQPSFLFSYTIPLISSFLATKTRPTLVFPPFSFFQWLLPLLSPPRSRSRLCCRSRNVLHSNGERPLLLLISGFLLRKAVPFQIRNLCNASSGLVWCRASGGVGASLVIVLSFLTMGGSHWG